MMTNRFNKALGDITVGVEKIAQGVNSVKKFVRSQITKKADINGTIVDIESSVDLGPNRGDNQMWFLGKASARHEGKTIEGQVDSLSFDSARDESVLNVETQLRAIIPPKSAIAPAATATAEAKIAARLS